MKNVGEPTKKIGEPMVTHRLACNIDRLAYRKGMRAYGKGRLALILPKN